jgi:membrane dipeptidase
MNDIIVDAHQDIAWNYFQNRRDFTRSVREKRRRETDPVFLRRYGRCMVGLPDMIAGRVAVVCGSIYVTPAWAKMFPDETILYTDPPEAHRHGMEQVRYYRRLAEDHEQIDLICAQSDLDSVLASWDDGTEADEHRVGIVMSMEGADPITEPDELEQWHQLGLRVIGPAWTATRYSGGTKAPGPLTDLGRELLDAMQVLGMVLDLAHMAPQACYEALERYEGPLYASHANPLRCRPSRPDRNLSDEIIGLIAERGGVVGIMPYNLFLLPEWEVGDPKDAATMEHVVTAIDHVCQITSSAQFVGIGSDFDGGFGAESAPRGFETVSDLQEIGSALAVRGYSVDNIQAILGGNMLRILRAGLAGNGKIRAG